MVYEVNAAGSYTVLYSFSGGAAGANPYAGVILDPAGNLYGTTYLGGLPQAGVIRDPEGNLYGTTYSGGTKNGVVVFKLTGVAAE